MSNINGPIINCLEQIVGSAFKKRDGFTLSVFAMMVYVSGINERFNSDIVKTHNKISIFIKSTYSIKDSVHTTSSSI